MSHDYVHVYIDIVTVILLFIYMIQYIILANIIIANIIQIYYTSTCSQ